MDRPTEAVIEAAVAYCDQLCSFNLLDHPEVQRRRLELAEAVGAYHNRPAPEPAQSDREIAEKYAGRFPGGLEEHEEVNYLILAAITEAKRSRVVVTAEMVHEAINPYIDGNSIIADREDLVKMAAELTRLLNAGKEDG